MHDDSKEGHLSAIDDSATDAIMGYHLALEVCVQWVLVRVSGSLEAVCLQVALKLGPGVCRSRYL